MWWKFCHLNLFRFFFRCLKAHAQKSNVENTAVRVFLHQYGVEVRTHIHSILHKCCMVGGQIVLFCSVYRWAGALRGSLRRWFVFAASRRGHGVNRISSWIRAGSGTLWFFAEMKTHCWSSRRSWCCPGATCGHWSRMTYRSSRGGPLRSRWDAGTQQSPCRGRSLCPAGSGTPWAGNGSKSRMTIETHWSLWATQEFSSDQCLERFSKPKREDDAISVLEDKISRMIYL